MANKKNVTISVDKDIYNKYTKSCKNKGLVVSRQFELLMEKHLRYNKK